MERNIKPESPDVLAVEGKDECNFFDALAKNMGLNEIQIIDVGGKEKFNKTVPLFVNSEQFWDKVKRFGFIRDAEDKEALSAFSSICDVLKHCDLPVPASPLQIAEANGMQTGVFIMPNNQSSGMLEDLCLSSIKNDEVYSCVAAFVQCYEPKIEHNKYIPSKAKLLAYLATRTPIVNSLGLAAQQNVWDFGNPCFDKIKMFLSELFSTRLVNFQAAR
jgi:hypothetical protein